MRTALDAVDGNVDAVSSRACVCVCVCVCVCLYTYAVYGNVDAVSSRACVFMCVFVYICVNGPLSCALHWMLWTETWTP